MVCRDLTHIGYIFALTKRSISAMAGERCIIFLNMIDYSLICIGKGDEDWNNSASYGAGRIMSRGKAYEK